MTPKKAIALAEAWGEKACDYPRVELMGHFGTEICGQCGRLIKRGATGQPIPASGPDAEQGKH